MMISSKRMRDKPLHPGIGINPVTTYHEKVNADCPNATQY